MARPSNGIATYEGLKPAQILPHKGAAWISDFNDLIIDLNSTGNLHPLTKELGKNPTRNELTQLLISIGIEKIQNYDKTISVNVSDLPSEFVDLLRTDAGQTFFKNMFMQFSRGMFSVSPPLQEVPAQQEETHIIPQTQVEKPETIQKPDYNEATPIISTEAQQKEIKGVNAADLLKRLSKKSSTRSFGSE